MTRLRTLLLLLALCILLPARALPPQTPAPPKTGSARRRDRSQSDSHAAARLASS